MNAIKSGGLRAEAGKRFSNNQPRNIPPRRLHLAAAAAAVVLLSLLNCNSTIHGAIIGADTGVAYALNSLVGINCGMDRLMGWLNTRLGDLAVISSLGLIFVAHSLRAPGYSGRISRLAFWSWSGMIVLTTYVGIWLIEGWISRPIPLQVLHLHNGHTMNGLHLSSSANESFPSGHALAFTLFVLMSCKRYPKMSVFLALVGAVMLPIRLALGLHWLSDMVFGSLALSCLLTALAYDTPLNMAYYFIRRSMRYALKAIRTARSGNNRRSMRTLRSQAVACKSAAPGSSLSLPIRKR